MRVYLRDGLGIIGAGLLSYGCWSVYPPAGFIALGVMLIAGAILTALGE